MPLLQASEWESFLNEHPQAHLLQTTAWGDLKSEFGWDVARLLHGKAGAQVLFRRLPLGFTLAYIPKGPVGESGRWKDLWPELDKVCRARKAILLKMEPDLWETQGGNGTSLPEGFRLSSYAIQPPRTILVDLEGEEESILARMKQKTRYNIRLALKKGVVVRTSSDLDKFYRLIQRTGERNEFGVHNRSYYQRVFDLFHPHGECELFLAEFQHEPLAAIMVLSHGQRSWYFYGASADLHRHRMPTYLLQWEAMRWARNQGCTEYDLWGVPDADEDCLESNFTQRSDGLWGVYRFKRGFGGQLRRSAGPWDRVYQPAMYAFYQWWTRRRGAG
ncbi:MAG TPA: peptidoglycan bridge formation glycyltransferase FemA/FemB family protein [Anaerolineales bacterium]|nr:peptidoglycan bridge formation glycyltransferase FemA/FemB family protein [Anaerolineales bacterium]